MDESILNDKLFHLFNQDSEPKMLEERIEMDFRKNDYDNSTSNKICFVEVKTPIVPHSIYCNHCQSTCGECGNNCPFCSINKCSCHNYCPHCHKICTNCHNVLIEQIKRKNISCPYCNNSLCPQCNICPFCSHLINHTISKVSISPPPPESVNIPFHPMPLEEKKEEEKIITLDPKQSMNSFYSPSTLSAEDVSYVEAFRKPITPNSVPMSSSSIPPLEESSDSFKSMMNNSMSSMNENTNDKIKKMIENKLKNNNKKYVFTAKKLRGGKRKKTTKKKRNN